MNFEKAIEKINSSGISVYEISKKTGLNQSGLSRVLSGAISKPQNKTKNILIKIAEEIEKKGHINSFKDLDLLKPSSTLEILKDLPSNSILDHLLTEKDKFKDDPKIEAVVALYAKDEILLEILKELKK